VKIRYIILGLVFDILDVASIFLPIVNDLIDLVCAAIWFLLIGPVGLTAALEIIPFADPLPVNTAIGVIAAKRKDHSENGRARASTRVAACIHISAINHLKTVEITEMAKLAS
jgi:hypothetical protein